MPIAASANRGQANAVGFVLLIGLTIVSVTGVVVIGAQGLGALEDEATEKQVQHAFTGPIEVHPGSEFVVTITTTDDNGNTDSETESETA